MLIAKYLNTQSKIEHFFREFMQLTKILRAINKRELNFVKCLNMFDVESNSKFNDNNNSSIKFLKLHTQIFIQTIDNFFIILMRFH